MSFKVIIQIIVTRGEQNWRNPKSSKQIQKKQNWESREHLVMTSVDTSYYRRVKIMRFEFIKKQSCNNSGRFIIIIIINVCIAAYLVLNMMSTDTH